MKFVVDSSIVFFFDELVPATSRRIFVKTTIMNEFHFIDRACCEDRSGSIKKKRKRVRNSQSVANTKSVRPVLDLTSAHARPLQIV